MRALFFGLLLAAPALAQTELQKLGSPLPQEDRTFGWSVASAGGWLAVGAPEASGAGLGKVFLYRENRGTWELFQTIFPLTQRRSCFAQRMPPGSGLCHEVDFGIALAMSADRLLVGARGTYRGSLPDHAGQAFLYRYSPQRGRWEEEIEFSQLATPSPGLLDSFGWAVALDGDVALVGAPDRDTNTGCAYVFERTTSGWSQTGLLSGNTPGPDHYFGTSVALDGDRIAVGEPREFDAGYRAGAVYVFRRSAGLWLQEDKVLPESQFVHSPATAYFGQSVDLEADLLVVGAVFYGASAPTIVQDNPGAAYVYRRQDGGGPQWSFEAALAASDQARENEFGSRVAISGHRIVVSAPQFDWNEPSDDNSGSAYVFGWTGTGWLEEFPLRPFDTQPGQYFGISLACAGGLLVVGSAHDDNGGLQYSGSAYVFDLWP